MRIPRALLDALYVGGFLLAAFSAAPSSAYPWMISHGYNSCQTCHVDPSGAGQLSVYGRAMSDLVVRWHADPKDLESGEPSPSSGFLWGLTPEMPEWLNVSGNFRGGGLINVNTSNPGSPAFAPPVMATDLNTTLTFGSFVAHATAGFGYKAMGPAVVVSADPATGQYALVSRDHWLGYKLLDDSLFIRAGRLPVPFGLRNYEHVSFVRSATRTDINVQQQHGVAVAYSNDFIRGEVMALLGNYQIAPDIYRERGYSAFAEIMPMGGFAVGASSLLTLAAQDINAGTARSALRHAHGVFTRWAPMEQLVLLAEADALVNHVDNNVNLGGAGWLQLDWIPIQGVHILPAAEGLLPADGVSPAAASGWLSVGWYALPHTELRLDTRYTQTFPTTGASSGSVLGLLMLHFFL